MNIGNLFMVLLADGARLGPSVTAEAQKAGDAGGQTLAQSMGASLRKNASKFLIGAGAAIGAFVAGATGEFAKFDDQMREVFSIMPGISKAAMDKMKADVLDVSKQYGILTDDLIPALQTAIGSGIPENNVMDFLRVAAKAAKAGATDTETSVKALAASINAFQIPVEDAGKVADAFFNAIDKGVTTFPELAASMSEVAPVAAAMGIRLEDVLAAITAMTLQGEPTSGAITKVTASLTALQRTTPEMEDALKGLGFATGQAAIDALGYQGTMEALRRQADKMGVPLIKLTGRLEGAGAILQLTGDNAARARDILGTFGDTTGKVDAAFETMEGGIGGTTRRALATIKAWVIQVGGAFAPIAPIFQVFGPLFGRALGAAIGGAFGAVAPHVVKLGKAIAVRLGDAIVGKYIANAAASGIGEGLELAGKSPIVSGAASKLGAVLGTTAGTAFSVAFAAAALVLMVKTFIDIRQGLVDQSEQIGKDLAKQFEVGTLDQLKQSRGAIEQGMEDLNGVFDLGLFTDEARARLRKQLADVQLHITQSTQDMREGVGDMQVAVAKDLRTVAQRFGEFGDASTDARDTVRTSLGDMVRDSRDMRQAFLSDVSQLIDDYYAPIEAHQQLQAINADIAAQKEIIASKSSTTAQIADAKQRLTELTKNKEQVMAELLSYGELSKKTLNKWISDSTKKWQKETDTMKKRVLQLKIQLLAIQDIWNQGIGSSAGIGGNWGGHASGGMALAGVPTWVGERGPELAVPTVTSQVYSHLQAPGMDTGGESVTVHLSTYGTPMYAPTPWEIGRQTRRAVKEGVATPRRRVSWRTS